MKRLSVFLLAVAALTVAVQTAAAGCTTSPSDINAVVRYRMR
jgi:hypothetical protein